MWQDKLKEIIYILENSNVNEIDIHFWGRKYRVVKSAGVNVIDQKSNNNPADLIRTSQENLSQDDQNERSVNFSHNEILSPMPGTFYTAPSPEAELFVKPGDTVKKGDTLCIIEAMKIMNEIESEIDGTVSEIFIENSDPIEYNQPLFKINPL